MGKDTKERPMKLQKVCTTADFKHNKTDISYDSLMDSSLAFCGQKHHHSFLDPGLPLGMKHVSSNRSLKIISVSSLTDNLLYDVLSICVN